MKRDEIQGIIKINKVKQKANIRLNKRLQWIFQLKVCVSLTLWGVRL